MRLGVRFFYTEIIKRADKGEIFLCKLFNAFISISYNYFFGVILNGLNGALLFVSAEARAWQRKSTMLR